jgi:23S rRNA (uracil1939-C5)-methyltransferase
LLLTIEKLIYGGDGLARLSADGHGRGKAVFLPFVLAGEKTEAVVTGQKSGFARAHANEIIEASPHRIEPRCPYFARCGGCHYQHANYEHQLEIKKEILRETLRRTAKLELPCDIEVHASPPWNYRNRSRLQVRFTPSFTAGYFRLASHDLLAVEQCPISSPLINRGIAILWQHGRAGKVPSGVREVEFFASADDTQMLVELGCAVDSPRSAGRAFAEDLQAAMPEIAGVTAFVEARTRAMPRKLVSVGDDWLSYKTARGTYRVSAGSFFQTNRFLTDELVKIVTKGQAGDLALDLYAGVGLFSTALASVFHHIVSVESSQLSSVDLSHNKPSNGEAVQATTEEFLVGLQNSERVGKGAVFAHPPNKPDLAVVDPPRSGLGEPVARLLANLRAPQVAYVSCDPATLARDLVSLLTSGYRVERVHLVDFFPQTYHLETVVHLVR